MEINSNLRGLTAVGGTSHITKPTARDAQVAQDEVAFENSRALATALQNTPASREDIVRRATELVGDANYPPPETIRMISHLLAIQMHPHVDPS